MWKKVVFFLILISLYINLNVEALNICYEDGQYDKIIKIIAPYIENEDNIISRGDCVATIMKLIGVDADTALEYADSDYYMPVFLDIGYDIMSGYIIIAKYCNVAAGVDFYRDGVNNFMPDREVTVKEALTFMLRCLTDPQTLTWERIMEDSIKFGLLKEEELELYVADGELQSKQFYTLLCRMLDKNRYLYWPIEELSRGNEKSMQIDQTNSVKYMNFFLEKTDNKK